MAKDIVLRLSCDLEKTKYDFQDCETEDEVMDQLVYELDEINQQTGNGLKVIESKTVEASENIDMKQAFLTYLQSQMDNFQADLKKYGKKDRVVSKKCDAMIACKEMVEAILREPVNLGIDGIVTIGDVAGKENKYDDIFVLPSDGSALIHIAPGDGTNGGDSLEEGCVDYIYYDVFDLAGNEVDGGQLDIDEEFEEKYNNTDDCIFDILSFIYSSLDKEAINKKMAGMTVFAHCASVDDLPKDVFRTVGANVPQMQLIEKEIKRIMASEKYVCDITIKQLLGWVYDLCQAGFITEAQQQHLYELIDTKVMYNEPAMYSYELCNDTNPLFSIFVHPKAEYRYGMRLRGFAPGCQPEGFIRREDDSDNKYLDIIVYERMLSEYEMNHYSLDILDSLSFLTKEEVNELYSKVSLAILWPDGTDSSVEDQYTLEQCFGAMDNGAKIFRD